MKLLIGNTGLIGKTLKDNIKFDYEFNSKNINDLLTIEEDFSNADLYLCCLPATKWLINKNPQADLDNIFGILDIITKKEYRNIILYSTIDVYSDVPLQSDESYPLQVNSPSYGSNRLLFEKLVASTLKYSKLLILRLPALFGKHLKKNILFDLINNNEIHKINYNSKYQWYNLNDLAKDSIHCLNLEGNRITINLFSEPVNTSDIILLFDKSKSEVDTTSKSIVYDFRTNTNPTYYVKNKNQILEEIKHFISSYKLSKTRMAICLFGEPRDILHRITHWKNFISHFNVDFYLALYSNNDINETIKTITSSLPVKSYFVTKNDLDYFNKLKFKAKRPINIHTADPKATFPRITSQCYIRQKAVSLVELKDYDVVMLCRSDYSNFNISSDDIINVSKINDLLIVNSGYHVHPGGGNGCVKCNTTTKCDLEFHANDICDYWCMGSPNTMYNWLTFYDKLLDNYHDIQKTIPQLKTQHGLEYINKLEENEILISLPTGNWFLIENDVHCFYPEKLIRSSFRNNKIVGAESDKKLWHI